MGGYIDPNLQLHSLEMRAKWDEYKNKKPHSDASVIDGECTEIPADFVSEIDRRPGYVILKNALGGGSIVKVGGFIPHPSSSDLEEHF